MQSLYKVIKKNSVVRQGEEKIKTNYKKPVSLEKEIEKEKEIEEENSKKFIDSYENLARNILENARKKSEEFLSKAYAEAEVVEEEAFKKGHEEGFHKGSEEGKNPVMKKLMKLI
ncbi:hypothetical protein JQ038_13460 [Clostridium botulinum]|nr:hypothetical protein [Clostridium botulinum]